MAGEQKTMSTKEPTFPRSYVADGHTGMTLRDYFAAKTMAAMIAHHGIYDEKQPSAGMTSATALDYHSDSVSKIAYVYADAMLAERERA